MSRNYFDPLRHRYLIECFKLSHETFTLSFPNECLFGMGEVEISLDFRISLDLSLVCGVIKMRVIGPLHKTRRRET